MPSSSLARARTTRTAATARGKKRRTRLQIHLEYAKELAKIFLTPDLSPDACNDPDSRHPDNLEGLKNPGIASGQCMDRSKQFNQLVRSQAKKKGLNVRLQGWEGCHWFSILSKDGKDPVVIDFTFRQFSGRSPFPIICPLREYQIKYFDAYCT